MKKARVSDLAADLPGRRDINHCSLSIGVRGLGTLRVPWSFGISGTLGGGGERRQSGESKVFEPSASWRLDVSETNGREKKWRNMRGEFGRSRLLRQRLVRYKHGGLDMRA